MNGPWAFLAVCGIALFTEQRVVRAEEIVGRVLDAQTGEPIARARVMVRVYPPGGQSTELEILTDAGGTFTVRNLPDGSCQLSGEKAGYLGNPTSGATQSIAFSRDSKPASVVLRLTRQGVIEGSVVDEKAGVPFASIQLLKPAIVEGRRRIQHANGAQTDEKGEFRVFGLAAGRYYLGVTAQVGGLRRSKALAYPPVLYPNATDISGAQLIDLQPGQEAHVQVRLQALPAHEIRGQAVPAGRYMGISLRPQQPDRFPVSPNAPTHWDEKTRTFKISGVTSGVYVLEATTEIDGQQRRASATVAVGDTDIDGIRLEPASLPALTGNVRVEGQEISPHPVSYVALQSPQTSFGAQVEADGSFHLPNLALDTYRVALLPAGSFYVRSIRQGARDVLRDGLVVAAETPPDPLEIVLSSHGATIEGAVSLPDSDQPGPVLVALLRRVGDDMIMEKQAYVNPVPAVAGPARGAGRFVMQGVAPGEYVLFAWPPAAQIESANPEFMRQYDALGKAISVTEDARVSVNLDRLLPNTEVTAFRTPPH